MIKVLREPYCNCIYVLTKNFDVYYKNIYYVTQDFKDIVYLKYKIMTKLYMSK